MHILEMSLVEAQAGLTNLIPCNENCGGDYSSYCFTQTDSEVVISVPLPEGTATRTIVVIIGADSLTIGLKGQSPILNGRLYMPIKASESTWSIEDKHFLVVTLIKQNIRCEEWWPHVIVTEPQIDMKTLRPPSKHIRDLDSGAQATIAKMMFDQEQKRKGLPTSEEMKIEEMMKSKH